MSHPTADVRVLVLYADHDWVSPWVFSAYVAVREKNVPFAVSELNLDKGDHRKPAYVESSMTARVPTLVHGDFWLTESSAIVEYLDEVFPGPEFPRLLPVNVRARARARQIMSWLRSDLGVLREERPSWSLFYDRVTTPLSPEAQAAAEKLLRVAEKMVPEGSNTMFGEFTVADADLAFMLQRLILNRHDVPARLRRYAATHWARPSARDFVERPRPPRAG